MGKNCESGSLWTEPGRSETEEPGAGGGPDQAFSVNLRSFRRFRGSAEPPSCCSEYDLLKMALGLAGGSGPDRKARRLLKWYGTLAKLLDASPEELKTVGGVSLRECWVLSVIAIAARHVHRPRHAEGYRFPDEDSMLDYLALRPRRATVQTVSVVYLDAASRLILDEEMWRGTLDAVAIYPREIVRRALAVGASQVVILRGHPSADPEFNAGEEDAIWGLVEALGACGVRLLDYWVVGEMGALSLRRMEPLSRVRTTVVQRSARPDIVGTMH